MHEQYLRRAIRLAVENVEQGRGGPFGAVIVRDGAVVAEAANRVTTIPDPTAHAEVLAIREAARCLGTHNLSGCVIYASCEPCPMCLGAIYWARLDAVYFAATRQDAAAAGFDDSFLYDEIPLSLEKRSKPAIRLECGEGSAPFDAWRAAPGRTPY
ncbi:MAG: nucleoside deaminase [Bryobacteraceae bacterium]|nr:nucleoside deaminase [Bryobacteraceae bacterium]